MADIPRNPPQRPPSEREDALAVVRRLREAGHVAYFAGGCVRDQLLGLQPKDWDVATDAPPDRVRHLFSSTQAVGAAFGVILVKHRKSTIEVATFRTDLEYKDGRRPEGVRFATAEEDAQRRDFTINGLFQDPIEDRIIDYVGGQADLMKRVLRAIGDPDHRFEEDHLRLLRAVRFAARFGLTIEPATADAIGKHAQHLQRISPERIADECRRMLTVRTRAVAWEQLWRFGLLEVVLRALPERVSWPPFADKYEHYLFPSVAPGESISFGLALAAVVLCYRASGRDLPPVERLVSPPEVRRSVQACRTTLRISNDEAETMAGCLAVAALLGLDPPRVATMKRFLAAPTSADARRLLDAMLRAWPGRVVRVQWLLEQFARLERDDVAPPPVVTGDDLTAAGLPPGPLFKRVLDAVYDAQLEDRVRGKNEAMELALRLAQEAPPPPR